MDQLLYVDGAWHTGNHATMGPITQSVWMATAVFEGMRSFRGTAPDIDRHAERLAHFQRGLGPGAQVRLAADGPVETDDPSGYVARELVQGSGDPHGELMPRSGIDGQAHADQPFAFGFPPCCDVVARLRMGC